MTLPAHFIEHCESLGIPQELAAHIADEWMRVRATHGITTAAIEQCVVHDGWRVATNIDRIDVLPDGRHVCADIKSAANVVKAAYLLQLAVGASSVKYDPDSGERTPWPVALDRTVGHIWHFPIGEAIKAHAEGRPLPTWTLVTVDLAHGFALGEMLHALKTDTQHKDAFAAPAVRAIPAVEQLTGDTEPPHSNAAVAPVNIAAPTPPPVVEQRAGEVERTANAKASPALSPLLEASRAVTEQQDNRATLDELRATVATWSDDNRAGLSEFMTRTSVDRTDAGQVAAAIESYTFKDVTTTPVPRPAEVTPPPVISVKPDEGDAIDEASVALIGAAYKALPDDVRSWVTVNGAKVRLSATHGGVPSVRRFEVMRGLIAMARAGFDNDETLRGALDLAIGTDTQISWSIPSIVGALTLEEAQRFASICVDHLEHGAVSITFSDPRRAVISRSAA